MPSLTVVLIYHTGHLPPNRDQTAGKEFRQTGSTKLGVMRAWGVFCVLILGMLLAGSGALPLTSMDVLVRGAENILLN